MATTTISLPRAGLFQPGAAREVCAFLFVTIGIAMVITLAQRALGMDMAHLDTAPEAALALIPILAGAPGIAALATRVLFHGTLRGADFGLRRWSGRAALIAALLPLGYVTASYVAVYGFGLGGFDVAHLGVETVVTLATGALAMGVLALFEELGWRGFLVPALVRLVPAPQVVLLSGLAWAAFHFPLLLLVPVAHGLPTWYGVATFTLGIVAASVPYVWLRLRSGSLWPPVVLHTVHNALIYSLFEPLTVHTDITPYAQGEQGFTLVLAMVIVGAIFWRPALRSVREAVAVGPGRDLGS